MKGKRISWVSFSGCPALGFLVRTLSQGLPLKVTTLAHATMLQGEYSFFVDHVPLLLFGLFSPLFRTHILAKSQSQTSCSCDCYPPRIFGTLLTWEEGKDKDGRGFNVHSAGNVRIIS